MRPSNAVRTVWDAEAIDNLAPRLSANPENCYHPLQFGVHSGNPESIIGKNWWPFADEIRGGLTNHKGHTSHGLGAAGA
jgi:hypothetical protein